MRRCAALGILVVLFFVPPRLEASGIIIPVDKEVPPLAMLRHRVQVTIDDQVAITKVEQTFRNHTDRNLEATYVFPVPRGASVRDFVMYIDGKPVKGEKIEASKARHIYNEIVRRTQDPGLLEYIGHDLLQMRIFPIAPRSDQKVEVTITNLAQRQVDLVEYVYPLRTVGRAAATTLEEFSMSLKLRSTTPLLNIYSPTHAIAFHRKNDHEATVKFEQRQAALDRDFQLYYTLNAADISLTALQHRPLSTEDGYFLMLISPRAELNKVQHAPRDMVFVLDTSGSMREDDKLATAKEALKQGLGILKPTDRFGVVAFATTVSRYQDALVEASSEQIAQAQKWIGGLEPSGGTAIDDALEAALSFPRNDSQRTLTVVFLTDGKPTIGEMDTERILKKVQQKNTHHTRIFSFGVGNDLNAAFLDQLSEQTRAVCTYVRPKEDMEVKTSTFFTRISHPVLTDLKLSAKNARLSEIYPPQLPDLYHGGQLVVIGRFTGQGKADLVLEGSVAGQMRSYPFTVDFTAKAVDKPFVEELWGRRKVGFLLDQIRLNGEKQELVDEVVKLSMKYGIATPYTSYLIVPDQPIPVAWGGRGGAGAAGNVAPPRPVVLYDGIASGGAPAKLVDLIKEDQKKPGEAARKRGELQERELAKDARAGANSSKSSAANQVIENYRYQRAAGQALRQGDNRRLWVDQAGVNLAQQFGCMKNQSCLTPRASQMVQGRNCVEYGGVWIDEGYQTKTPTCVVQTMSDAYFRILERHPEVKEVFQLGNYLVWLTPSGTALVLDMNDGQKSMSDADIDKLFKTN